MRATARFYSWTTNTRNPDTDNYSGATAHLDVSVTKNVTENFAIGAIAGFLYQFEDDDSPYADTHDGFKGRSIAIGPLISYRAKFGENTEVDFRLNGRTRSRSSTA